MTEEAELPEYFRIFTPQERMAANAAQEIRCKICDKMVIGYTSMMNYYDFFDTVCIYCKDTYGSSFEAKRKEWQRTKGSTGIKV
jgi:hypothetical protein